MVYMQRIMCFPMVLVGFSRVLMCVTLVHRVIKMMRRTTPQTLKCALFFAQQFLHFFVLFSMLRYRSVCVVML